MECGAIAPLSYAAGSRNFLFVAPRHTKAARLRRTPHARPFRGCYNTFQMTRSRSHFGRITASGLLMAVICLQFCATTCALGNCTSPNLERSRHFPVTQKSGHCHQNSHEDQSSEKPANDDNHGCHTATEVIAAFT